jgi:VWFA-related protein
MNLIAVTGLDGCQQVGRQRRVMKPFKLLGLITLLGLTLGVSPNRDFLNKDRTITFDVAVTDKNNNPVTGLDERNFKIFADGVEQSVVRVSRSNRPLAVVAVVELSEAFAYHMMDAAGPAIDLMQLLRPEEWGAVVSFDTQADIIVDFTHDRNQLISALRRLRIAAFSDGAVYDSLYFVLDRMGPLEEKKVILLVGTGRDTRSSRRTYAQLLRKAELSGAAIYTVGLTQPHNVATPNAYPDFEEQARRRDDEYTLRSLSEATGGLSFFPQVPGQYSAIAQTVDRDLRNQYTLSFVPSNAEITAKVRKLKVEVVNTDIDSNGKPDKLTVRHRTGF